jgi:hypothetical protein
VSNRELFTFVDRHGMHNITAHGTLLTLSLVLLLLLLLIHAADRDV